MIKTQAIAGLTTKKATMVRTTLTNIDTRGWPNGPLHDIILTVAIAGCVFSGDIDVVRYTDITGQSWARR